MKKIFFAVVVTGFLLMTTACSSSSTNEYENKNTNASTQFPITMKHAFGETTITEKPERIATIAWGNQDVPLALGVAPVGVSKGNFGELTKDGLSPWTQEAFKKLEVTEPVVYDDTDGLDYEAIADSNPDIILAAYSGLTQEEYDTLSKIAPVVAYPRVAWQTYWREQVTINAEAMGMKDEGEALVKETEQLIANKLKEYPQIEGKSGAFLWVNPADTSSFYVYLTSDPRASYLTDLGLSFPENIKEMGKDETTFSLTVSAENADILNNVDILVTYGDDTTLKALQKDAIFGKIPAIKRGSVVVIDSNSALAGSATPTVLGISATIDEYLSLIGQAADKVNE